MKKIKITYWVVTGLFSVFMLFSSIPDVLCTPEAIAFMQGQLGYPIYFISFIGVAKTLGVIAILIPGNFPRIKEWVYAGIFFDLVGATYSIFAIAGLSGGPFFMLLPLSFEAASYFLYHKIRSFEKPSATI